MINEANNQYRGPSENGCGHSSMTTPLPAYPIPIQYQYSVAPHGYPTGGGPAPATAMQWNYLQAIPINLIPPGTIPIPVQDLSKSIAEGTPICPVTVAEQFAQMSVTNAGWGAMAPAAVPMAIPIQNPAAFHSAPIDPSQEPREANVAVVPPLASHEDYESSASSSGTFSRRSTTTDRYDSVRQRSSSSVTDYDEQIAERKRMEAEDAERDRYEEERVIREKEEKIRRQADAERKQKEEERMKEQEKERIRRTLEEALERAKHEAEITRKARVFKHVLEGADKSPELERRLLGVDPETGDRILHEISQMERHKKLEREALSRRPSKGSDQQDKPSLERRSRSAQPKSRTSSMSESFSNQEVHDDKSRNPSGVKQTASIRPFNSADNRVTRGSYESSGIRHPASFANGCTPLRRSIPGRMSVRVTRKEKENSIAGEEDCNRNTVRAMTRPSHTPPVGRDQRMPPSKIPIATPFAAKSGSRPSTLPPQPLRSANHFPAVESEAVQLIKSIPTNTQRPRNLFPSEDCCDNPLFSPVATRHRRTYRMRGLTDSPVNVDSAGSSGGSTEENHEGNTSSGTASPQSAAQSPIPAVAISHETYNAPKSILTSNNNELKIRSALSSPAAYLNQTPRSSTYVKRLVEKGCNKHAEDILSPDVRRKAEANLSRTPSVQSLRGSMGNLAGWRGSVSNLAEDPLNMNRFKSLNPSYRSFNAKKNTEKQQEVIDRLSRLRENLRSRENFVERGVLPKHQVAPSSTAVKT
nr:Hypothetical protein CBG24832 [Haemonchus contortus]